VSVKFDEWRVIRQFVEKDRVVVIYCIVIETTEFALEPVNGIRLLEQVYIVLRHPSGSGGVATSGTQVQTCYRLEPVQYKSTPGLENTVAAVTDFMFAFISGRISINYQMIERELRTAALHCT
jgi:hypothetical protein